MTDLFDAHKQWATRPRDERFASLDDLPEFTGNRKRASIEDVRPLRGLKLYGAIGGALTLNGSMQTSLLTNWAFTQLCQQAAAPSGYLNTLPAEIAAQCLEHGISSNGGDTKILIRKNEILQENKPQNMVSAFTSPSYGRIWDCDTVEAIMESIRDSTPPSYGGDNCGLYASDRDMFIFLVTDEKPVEVGNARFGREFFCWNSETGAATFGLTPFLYNYVCANQIVWGAE
ncbi:conserved hypothetical protein [Candidatus Zixiibacteriota bacterium]|nr:conserved hypothetical protein [candidate division Zixibacteria bacterium]